MVIADAIAPIADAAFGLPGSELNTASAWLGGFAFTLQIYFDFSGYSDMAIGLGQMLGFRLPENFNRPYSAVSITDFWRRWHMSLSRWFRDYLYIPLGGNAARSTSTYRNLFVVFLLVRLLARRRLDVRGLGGVPRRGLARDRARDHRGWLELNRSSATEA